MWSSFICIPTWDAGRCTVNSINSVPQSTWCNDLLWKLFPVAAGAAALPHSLICRFSVSRFDCLPSYFRTRSHSQCIKGKMCCISLLLSAPLAPPTFASISLDSLSSSSMFSPVRHENVGKVGVCFFFRGRVFPNMFPWVDSSGAVQSKGIVTKLCCCEDSRSRWEFCFRPTDSENLEGI